MRLAKVLLSEMVDVAAVVMSYSRGILLTVNNTMKLSQDNSIWSAWQNETLTHRELKGTLVIGGCWSPTKSPRLDQAGGDRFWGSGGMSGLPCWRTGLRGSFLTHFYSGKILMTPESPSGVYPQEQGHRRIGSQHP